MTAKKWALIVLALLFILFCTYWYEDEIRGYPAPWTSQTASSTPQSPTPGSAGIANPASTNCVTTLGGTLEIADTAQGQVGYCHLKDGRVCEEWSLFRGGCTAPQQ